MLAMMLLEAVLVTYRGDVVIGRERYRDDGKAVVSEIEFAGQKRKVTLSRDPRHVLVESGDTRADQSYPPGTIVLDNGHWQAYAVAAEQWKDAAEPRKVRLMVPSVTATVDATIQVTPGAAGGRHVNVTAGPLVVLVDIDKRGAVVHARVPAQGLEVRPENESAPLSVRRSPPEGVVEERVTIDSHGARLAGSLWLPEKLQAAPPLLVMVAGSGPTDRDGNSALGLRTDCYRLLAAALAKRGIATLRWDKRGVGDSTPGVERESDLTIADFAGDVTAWLGWARAQLRFSSVTLAGHSEGGLIALLLGDRAPVDGVVLLATAGRPLHVVLREQLATKLDAAGLAAYDTALARLRAHQPLGALPEALGFVFRPTVLPFLESELDLDPVTLFRKLKRPATIIAGETDIQVSLEDAKLLAAARTDAKLVVVPRMNHVLKTEDKKAAPQESYNRPERALAEGLVDAVAGAVMGTAGK